MKALKEDDRSRTDIFSLEEKYFTIKLRLQEVFMYTKEFVKEQLQLLESELGRLPKYKDWQRLQKDLNLVNVHTVCRKYGGWSNAIKDVFGKTNVDRDFNKYKLICKNCNKDIYRTKCEIKRVKNSFCSKSCAARYNNSKYPKKISFSKEKLCKICNKKIKSTRKGRCFYCYHNIVMKEKRKKSILGYGENTLQDAIDQSKNYASKHKYEKIRQHAHRLFDLMNWKKQLCEKCGYDKHVELCHVRPICDFHPETKISEINSTENIMFLCPNCHWELDNLVIN